MRYALALLGMVGWSFIGYRVWAIVWPIDVFIAIGGAIACAGIILDELVKLTDGKP